MAAVVLLINHNKLGLSVAKTRRSLSGQGGKARQNCRRASLRGTINQTTTGTRRRRPAVRVESVKALTYIIDGLCVVILVDAVMSWFMPGAEQFPRSITALITGPLYAPVHAVLDPGIARGLDLAPLIYLVGLQAINGWIGKRRVR